MSGSAAVTVITVDDAVDIRDLVRRMGPDGGYDVIGEATDGLGAIEQTGRLQPDVVVLNVEMPGIDGITACLIPTRMPQRST